MYTEKESKSDTHTITTANRAIIGNIRFNISVENNQQKRMHAQEWKRDLEKIMKGHHYPFLSIFGARNMVN